MCGIVGYIGAKKVVPVIIEGLRKLEYRGYDSAGIAVVGEDGQVRNPPRPRKAPQPRRSRQKLPDRWHLRHRPHALGNSRPSHGRKCTSASRLHRTESLSSTTASSKIIYELKEQLQKEGHKFVTETDTEIVAHLVEKNAKGMPFEEAVRRTLKELRGIYSLVFLSAERPAKDRRRAHRVRLR